MAYHCVTRAGYTGCSFLSIYSSLFVTNVNKSNKDLVLLLLLLLLLLSFCCFISFIHVRNLTSNVTNDDIFILVR